MAPNHLSSNSANPNEIGKRQWEEMIVSWLFSERKQKKKNANRSTPCILVQNPGVLWKRTYSSSFFLSSHQLLGGGRLPGLVGAWGCFSS